MKILLIIPTQTKVYGMAMPPIYPPLGILYIASVLEKEGHEVRVIDMDVEGIQVSGVCGIVQEAMPGIVGFSCVSSTVNAVIGLTVEIKRNFPEIITIMGGIHATIEPEQTIENSGIDFISIGESERTIVELVKALDENRKDFQDIKGIIYKKNGVVCKTAPRELIEDLDSIPFPAFHLLRDLKKYSPPDAVGLPAIPIIVSRGCPGTCTYCNTKQIFGRRFRMRSTANILAEMDLLVRTFKAREIHFLDDTLTTNKKRLLDLCAAIKARDYKVRFEVSNGLRADMVDRETLLALKSIGLVNVGFGVESGNEEILKVIKKGITKDQVRKSVKLAKELGFETWAFFIIGLPEETEKTIQDTINFAIELDPDFAKFLILKPFPGTEIFNQLNSAGLVDCLDYDRYGVYTAPVHHLPTLSGDDILKWQKKAFRKFYLRPRKILSHLLRIKSFAQIKIVLKGTAFVLKNAFKFH